MIEKKGTLNSVLTLIAILLTESSSTSEKSNRPEAELRELDGSSGNHWSATCFSSKDRGRSKVAIY